MKTTVTGLALVFATICYSPRFAAQAIPDNLAIVESSAPIFLRPDPTLEPLAIAPVALRVLVLEHNDTWAKVDFPDPRLGRRVGWIATNSLLALKPQALQLGGRWLPPSPASAVKPPAPTNPTPPATAPADQPHPTASSPPTAIPPTIENRTTASQASQNAAPAVKPATSPSVESVRSTSAVMAQPPRQFADAQLTVPEGQKTKQVNVSISYAADTFQLVEKDTQKPVKQYLYKSFTAGEYSYSKSPRWKSGVFISPFLFLSSGKKHWFLVKTADDYAMMQLDKSNYKLIIAEWEIRTGLKAEAEGENK